MKLNRKDFNLLKRCVQTEYTRISDIHASMSAFHDSDLFRASQERMNELSELFQKIQELRIQKEGDELNVVNELPKGDY